jgi:hypothetical protein
MIVPVALLTAVLLAAPAGRTTRAAPASRAARTAPAATDRIAFLGLRPAETASLTGTAIARLPEAQRLREVAENVVEVLSGATVLRHDELRVALGPSYLVDLFECRDAPCQLKLAAPLRRKAVRWAVAGEYFAAPEEIRIRLRRFDLRAGQLADELTFVLPRRDAETLSAWRTALQPLFRDTGSVRVVTNVPRAACTLDGRPCDLSQGGVIANVPEGEHLLQLSQEGHRRAHRVVVVPRGKELRVVVPLEELPIQAQKAPDPNARVPTFEPPGETTQIAPFGLLRLAIGYDDVNAGDREDPIVLPRLGGVDEGGLVVLPRPAIAGVTVQAPRAESGWQVRGAFSTAWVKDAGPEIDSAFAEVVREDSGLRVMLGWGQGVVSSLTAGTLTLPEAFGDLAVGLVGVTVSQSIGPLVLEGFFGRHKAQFSPEADPGGSSPGPFGAAHVAFVSQRLVGRLYGDDYPLTLGVSAVYGTERVGLAAEREWAAAEAMAEPVVEDLPVWAASLEAHVPFGKVASLAGEAYVGEDVHLLEGALWQTPRLDPVTGRHTALRSAGGWAQLSVNVGDVEVRLLGGIDRIVRGLDAGVAQDGPAIHDNRLVAANVVWYLLDHLAFGLQLHAVRTTWEDPALGTATLRGAVASSQLEF